MSEVQAETKAIDLMPFCDPDPDRRYALQKPWREGEQVVATDGKILISCDPSAYVGELAEAEGRRPQKCWEILSPASKVTQWNQLPEYPGCTTCDGAGEFTKRCPHCHGAGEHRCECGHEHDCDFCEEKGETTEQCEACECTFGTRRIARRLANKLLPLPQTEWGVVTDDPQDIVFFRFVGGIGAVMPMMPRD